MPTRETTTVYLADDDDDDCLLFGEALNEISLPTQLTTVHNGEQLLQLLESENSELPHVLFLDLNMPRKNGQQCLEEIKQSEKLKKLKVVIFSTSFQQEVADRLYKNGALHYIRKPTDFAQLKNVIHQVLTIIQEDPVTLHSPNYTQPVKASYILAY